MNYLRKLPWICARGPEGGNCGGVQGAGVPGSAVVDGFLEAASTYSSAAAEAETSWARAAYFLLSFRREMQHIPGGGGVRLLQGAGK